MDGVTFTNILLATVGFLIVYVLNGIKSEITEVKSSMNNLSSELTKIDRRVVELEVRSEKAR